MSKVVLRSAIEADINGVLELYRHLNPNDAAPEPAKARHAWSSIMASDIVTLVVAELDGRLISCCTLVIVPNIGRGARPFALIENVVTAPDQRRQIGRAHV